MTDINKVDIGFLEEKPNWLLHPKFFPSKVGGKPAWLDLKNLPPVEELICVKCQDPLIFLSQIYAPYEELDRCFHRTIFVFICRNGTCCAPNSSDNFVVLRCQLARKNEFYSDEPSEEIEDKEFEMTKWSKLCHICGIKAPSHCSKCKKMFYCSRKHQVLDWQKEHKELCPNVKDMDVMNNHYFKPTKGGDKLLFKEWELIIDEEEQEEAPVVDEDKEMEKLQRLIEEKKVGTLNDVHEQELEQYAGSVKQDKVFKKFNKRIARNPDQVLRYDRGGKPLWITDHSGSQGEQSIPNCEYCNEERQFEFQIMPQLLNFIEVGIDVNSIDWGILAFYTCKNSCGDGPAYKKEFIIKQDLLQ